MAKPTIVGVAVALVLALGGAGYFLMNRDNDSSGSNSSQPESSQTEEQENATASEASFASINTSGKAQECTFDYSGSNGTGKGKMYADGRGRGRMMLNVTSEQGNSGETNTLVTNDKAYTWFTSGEGQSLGFVFDKSQYEQRSGSGVTDSTGGTDPSQKFSMSCKGWKVDDSMLTPPANINFTEFNIPS